jgi:DNA-binding response OmpR family regulator
MQKRILIAEDDIPFREVIGRNLSVRGYEVREAATAAGALAEIEREAPDVLLLDINLPDLSGWDMLRSLRTRGSELPTVIISAVRIKPERLAEFRPLAYLPKPFPIEALLRLVDRAAPLDRGGEVSA